MDQRSGVRLPLPLQCAPDPNSLEDPSKGARNPEAEEVPGGEQKIGRPSSTRRRTPLTSVLWELDPGLWPSLISNTKPGVWRPLYPHGGWPTRAWGRREEGPEPQGSQPDPRLPRATKLARARRPRAPVRAAPAAPLGTARIWPSSPYPPATGVGAPPRSAGATSGHGQLRAVETGVDREEDGAELQPRGHVRALA